MGISSMTLQYGGALLYVGAALAYLGYLTSPTRIWARLATGALALGVLGHTICFVARGLGEGLPVTSTGVILSALAWAVAGVWLIAQFFSKAVVVGAFVSPVAAVFALLAVAVPGGPLVMTKSPFGLLAIHLSSVFLGTAVFTLAGSVGVAYLIQERQLKQKLTGKLFRRLPSLDVLDRLGYRGQAFGFVCLTLALITGALIAAVTGKGMAFHSKPEVLATILLWAFYACALQLRLFAGWRGRKGAWFAVVGFCALISVFAGVRIVMSYLS